MSTTSGTIITTLQNNPMNQRNNKYKVVVDSQGNQFREYHLDYSQYIAQQKVFKWRQRTHHPIIKVTPVQQSYEKPFVCVRCEHVVVSLEEVGLMRIQEIIYCMSELLLGYQQVFNRLGYVCVEENMIGLNNKGQILLWVNSNPVVNQPGSFQLIRQQLILLRIVQVLSRKSSSHNNLFFLEIKKTPKTFSSYLDSLMQFKHKHKLKIIPRINVKRDNLLIAKNNLRAISNNSIGLNYKDQQQPVMRSLKQIGSKTTHLIPVNQLQQQLVTSSSTNFIRSPYINNTTIPQLTLLKQHNQSKSQTNPLTLSQTNSNYNLFTTSVGASNFNSTKSSIIQLNNHDTTNEDNKVLTKNNNGNNLRKQQRVKTSGKINSSYSQKRNDILLTPRQQTIMRQYTSDKQLPFLAKFQSQPIPVQQFTLIDLQKQPFNNTNKPQDNQKLNISKSVMLINQNKRRIVPSYSIVYSPDVGIVNLRTELQLKRSVLSGLSEKTCKSGQESNYNRGPFNKVSVCDNKNNKTSMTTNHRSITQSFQSLGNYSNTGNLDYVENYSNIDNADNTDNIHHTEIYFCHAGKTIKQKNVLRNTANGEWYGLGRKTHNHMFASDSSCRVSSSVIGESEGVKNTKSILINQSQLIDDSMNNTNEKLYAQKVQALTTDNKQLVNNTTKILNTNKGMYTFGGLIVPATQIKTLQQAKIQGSQMKRSPSRLSTSGLEQQHHPAKLQSGTSASSQSIEQFYKLMSLHSQKKSMILSQAHHAQLHEQNYQVSINPNLIGNTITPNKQYNSSVPQHNSINCVVQQRGTINHEQNNQQNNQYNLLSPTKYYSLNPQKEEEFDYNKWRGLKGLLNQSNVYELKQSIHCGPEVRAPLDFKLELLDKFGREITHSILPATPNRKYSSSCVKSIFIDQQQ